MIEKLTPSEMIMPYEVGKKINEIIDIVNKLETSPFVNPPYSITYLPPDKKNPYDWAEQTERMDEDDGA